MRGRAELLARVDRASDALEMFVAAAAQLSRLVPYDAAVWRVTDPMTGIMTAPVYVENIDGGDCPAYWEHELSEERVNRFRDLARARVPVGGLWESSGGRPTDSPLYRDFMRPRGIEDELRAVLRIGPHIHGHVSLFRQHGPRPFARSELAFVAGLVTPLARQLRSYARPSSVVSGGAERGRGLLVFDAAGTLHSADDAGLGYLDDLPDGPSIGSTDGRRIPAWLQIVVAHARSEARRGSDGDTRTLLRDRSGRWLACDVSSLRAIRGDGGSVAVSLGPASLPEIVTLAAHAYGLSEREVDVVLCLMRGDATDAIARQLVISRHTVRDHVKAIFEKFGVSSRGELVGALIAESKPGPL